MCAKAIMKSGDVILHSEFVLTLPEKNILSVVSFLSWRKNVTVAE